MSGAQKYLTVLSGKTDQKKYLVDKESFRVGRDPGCDMRLIGPEISLIHVLLQRAGDNYVLVKKTPRDVLVNGRATEQAVLKHNDEITIGGYVFCYQRSDAAGAPKGPTPGPEQDQAEGVKARQKKSNKTWLLVGVYLSFMFLLLAYLAVGRASKPIGEFKTAEDAFQAVSEEELGNVQLRASQRVEALKVVYEESKKVEVANKDKGQKMANRDEVFRLAQEALSHENRIPKSEAVDLLKTALSVAIPRGGDPYDDSYRKDLLFRFVNAQLQRVSG